VFSSMSCLMSSVLRSGVDGHFRGDRILPLRRDQQRRGLDTGEHREEQVQQDVGAGVEGLVMQDPLQEQWY
jgi:hypothetical protein